MGRQRRCKKRCALAAEVSFFSSPSGSVVGDREVDLPFRGQLISAPLFAIEAVLFGINALGLPQEALDFPAEFLFFEAHRRSGPCNRHKEQLHHHDWVVACSTAEIVLLVGPEDDREIQAIHHIGDKPDNRRRGRETLTKPA